MRKQKELLEQLKLYENEWVAIKDNKEVVVSGKDAFDVKRKAEKRGFYDVIFFKVFPFKKGYIPFVR